MIQRPPACERHAAELPGKAHIVPESDCPWCWKEDEPEDCYCAPGAPHKKECKP